jgi:peptidyl-prolyl cis-trans isomerase D
MLDALRAFSRTLPAKVMFAVLIVAFAIFGIGNVVTGLGGSTIARVGSQEVTTNDFQRAYQRQLNQIAQQTGQLPSADAALAMGVPSGVVSQLMNEAAVNDLGQQLGLGVSEQRLGLMLRDDQSFANVLGAFDRATFLQVLRQNGMTESEYFSAQTKMAQRQQIMLAMFDSAAVPKVALELIGRYVGDMRAVDYFTLTTLNVPFPPEPTDTDLTALLASNPEAYKLPERRTADILTLSAEQIAKGIEITDVAVAAEYERTRANMMRPERRTIWQVSLPDDAAAAIFTNAKAAGKTFDQAVEEAMLPVNDIGTLAQSEIIDATLASQAFSLAAGDYVLVPGATGQRVIHVAAIEPAGETTLEQARDGIRQQLALAQARTRYVDILDQIEELRAAFRPMAEIADRFDLDINEVELSIGGQELGVIETIPEADRARVAQAIFAGEEGRLTPTVTLAANRNAWFDIKAIEPARDQTLEEARAALQAAWFVEKSNAALKAETDRLVGLLKQGYPISDVAMSVGQFAQPAPAVGRNGDGTPVIDTVVATAMFAGGAGHVGSAVNGDGAQVIFRVNSVTPAAADANADLGTEVANALRSSLASDFIIGLRNRTGYTINETVLDQQIAATVPSAL